MSMVYNKVLHNFAMGGSYWIACGGPSRVGCGSYLRDTKVSVEYCLEVRG